MKISELIKELQSIVDTEGDLEVVLTSDCYHSYLNDLGELAWPETIAGIRCLEIMTK